MPEGRWAAIVLTAWCNALFCLRQLYAAAVADDQAYEEVLTDTLQNLICKSLTNDSIAQETRTAVALPGGTLPNRHTVTVILLCHYQMY